MYTCKDRASPLGEGGIAIQFGTMGEREARDLFRNIADGQCEFTVGVSIRLLMYCNNSLRYYNAFRYLEIDMSNGSVYVSTHRSKTDYGPGYRENLIGTHDRPLLPTFPRPKLDEASAHTLC